MSKISIIIPTINEANNLPLLLSDLSIIQKEGEIIVIDGGSQDKTKDIAKIYGAKIKNLSEDNEMGQREDMEKNSDSIVDSISAVLIILIPVAAIIYWLSGLPTS